MMHISTNPTSSRNRLTSEYGFSLIELLVVMAVVLILVSIAVMIYRDISKESANQLHNSNVRIIKGAIYMAFAEHGRKSFEIDENNGELVWHKDSKSSENEDAPHPCWNDYLQEWPEVPEQSDAYSESGNNDTGDQYKLYLEGTERTINITPPMVEE